MAAEEVRQNRIFDFESVDPDVCSVYRDPGTRRQSGDCVLRHGFNLGGRYDTFPRRGSGGAQTCGVIPVMPTPDILTEVRAALESIVDSLDGARFVIPGDRRDLGEPARDGVVQTVRQYLLPRLREPDAPVVAALVGLSGVGKSTILNSLAQERISPTGVLRPTTTNGVLWAHRSHAARYWTEFVGRVTEQIGPTTDIVIGDDPITRHLTFIDTPPLELPPAAKAATAAQSLMFADICIFVTSVARYGDRAPFAFLDEARSRGVPILFVLNRLPLDPGSRREILGDFADKLAEADLVPQSDPAFIFGVDESAHARWHGGLGPEAVGTLRKELSEISDPDFRIVVIDETAEAAVRAVADRADLVAMLLREDRDELDRLSESVDESYQLGARRTVDRLLSGDFAALADSEVWAEAAVDLSGVVTRVAGAASQETAAVWLAHPGGRKLVDPKHEGLRRHGANSAKRIRRGLDEWNDGLAELVQGTGRRRRRKRQMRRRVDQLWRSVLDPQLPTKRWQKAIPGVVDDGRRRLAAVIESGLASDAERFRLRLAGGTDAEVPDRVGAAVAFLRDMPPPGSDLETGLDSDV